MRPARLIPVIVLSVAALLAASPAGAQDYRNDVRVRFGIFSPDDLPTDEGPMIGIEVRNLLFESDGIYYGIAYYDEETTFEEKLGNSTFTVESSVELLPISIGWFHLWSFRQAGIFLGAGGGIYEVDASTFAVNPAGSDPNNTNPGIVGLRDFGPTDDDSRIGLQIFAGADFFPRSRLGLSAEARLHIVEDDMSGAEVAVSGLFRF